MLFRINILLTAILGLANFFLYCYPLLRGVSYLSPINRPPIRILCLADPQIEGDTKIAKMGWRGALDIFGNDLYLGHIHRVMAFFTKPTHTVVLGDHMSSQWIDDAEFKMRTRRLKERILRFQDSDFVFNVTGNHDIGYSGDMTRDRINRWKDAFGPVNYISEIDTALLAPGSTILRFVVLNDLHLDGPAWDEGMRGDTHAFLQHIPKDGATTILLTHLPMHKDAGLCNDIPYMSYYDYPRVLLREQNHLSPESTKAVLDQIFIGSKGVILSGHDHVGCDVIHVRQPASSATSWLAEKASKGHKTGVPEHTVRSMMGQFGGSSGLLSTVYDPISGWSFSFKAAHFIHNTWWWVINILNIVATCYFILYSIFAWSKVGTRIRDAFGQSDSWKRKVI